MVKLFQLWLTLLFLKLAYCQQPPPTIPPIPPITFGNGTQFIKGTTMSNSPKDIHYLAYTDPSNLEKYQEITIGDINSLTTANLKPGNIILVVDGFNPMRPTRIWLKDAYLKNGFTNIIIVDWKKLASSIFPQPLSLVSYPEVLMNIPKVGSKNADFINFLVQNKIITGGGDVHIVGFSLGAHVSGSTSRFLKKRYPGISTIERITGLDPAGPLNQLLKGDKLNKKRAKFVDCIHTDIENFGTPEALGHADFYINGGVGVKIPGCAQTGPQVETCAHAAAAVFYTKTIEGKQFKGCMCEPRVKATCVKPTSCKTSAIPGEYCPPTTRGRFYVDVPKNESLATTVNIG